MPMMPNPAVATAGQAYCCHVWGEEWTEGDELQQETWKNLGGEEEEEEEGSEVVVVHSSSSTGTYGSPSMP